MFYYASKLLWVLAQPSNVVAVVVAAALAALLLDRRRLGLWLLAPATLALLATGLLPLGQWLLQPLEERFPPPAERLAAVDGVIVLGGAIDLRVAETRGVVEFGEAAERNLALIELAARYPDARLVFSGGRDEILGTALGEAEVMRAFTRRHGLDGRVIFEDRARNTYENARLSWLLAMPQPGQRWLLVTSASHMPRAVGVFRQIGWPVIAYPVDYRTAGGASVGAFPNVARRWLEFDDAIKAWVGLIAYWLAGRIASPFPGPEA
jgi:uncharacterized SAM-binding protein YcdF (DUF218 family)